MSFLDKARRGLTKAVADHGDKIDQGIDKAAQTVNKRTGSKHASAVTTGAQKAKEALRGLDDKPGSGTVQGSARPGETTPPPPPTEPGPPTDPQRPTG